tara:strand:- start:602 stop:1585 length:984 start_codon:yes stop_codon:yes gene_type:complete
LDHIDAKYISLLSPRLERFKRIKPNLYNCRCPLCGDSKKNKSKARGYLYGIKTSVNYRCHNCGASMTFNSFLKKVDATLQSQYSLEKFKDGKTGKGTTTNEPNILEVAKESKPRFKRSIRIDLPGAYEEKKSSEYLNRRQVQGSFYYAKTFRRFINGIKPTFDNIRYDEERIVIPLYYNGDIVGVQGRALGPNSVKYITVMFDDDAPKIYGLDKIRGGTPVFVVEGPFDSTFLRNSIAMCGADGDVRKWGVSDPIWVYDNEPRSKEITKRISDTIDRGESVVIWPSHIQQKDINDMVLGGHNVQNLVESNTYRGLEATLKFNTWKRT